MMMYEEPSMSVIEMSEVECGSDIVNISKEENEMEIIPDFQ